MRKDRDEPVYAIGVAARLVECHPQTLRTYEALGLLRPSRTESNLRLYSDHDLDRVRQIKRLTYVGINLPGVEVILDRLEQMRQQMEAALAETQSEIEKLRMLLAGPETPSSRPSKSEATSP